MQNVADDEKADRPSRHRMSSDVAPPLAFGSSQMLEQSFGRAADGIEFGDQTFHMTSRNNDVARIQFFVHAVRHADGISPRGNQSAKSEDSFSIDDMHHHLLRGPFVISVPVGVFLAR